MYMVSKISQILRWTLTVLNYWQSYHCGISHLSVVTWWNLWDGVSWYHIKEQEEDGKDDEDDDEKTGGISLDFTEASSMGLLKRIQLQPIVIQ